MSADRIALGTFEYDARTGQVSLSAALRQIAGLTSAGPIGRDEFFALVDPGDRAPVAAALGPAPGANPAPSLCRFRRPSGETRWTVLRAEPLREADGTLKRVAGLVFDTTWGHDTYKNVHAALARPGTTLSVVRDAPVALAICGSGRVLDVNAAFTRLTGYAGADVASDAAAIWERLRLAEVMQLVQTAGRFPDQVWRVRTRDQRTLLVLVSAAPLPHHDPPAALVAFNEAAMRFETQSLLAEREERVRSLSAAPTEGLLFMERDVVIDCNTFAAQALAQSVDDLRGRSLVDLVDPASVDALRAWLSEERPAPRTLAFRDRDGRSRPFEVSMRVADRDNRPLRVVALRDLSERQRADRAMQALKESREQFRQLAEAHGEGVALQEAGRIVHANTTLASMFGYEADELIGRTLASLSSGEARDHDLHGAAADEPYVFSARRKDGTPFTAEVSPHTVNAGGRVYQVSTIRDVTHRERIAELRRALVAATAGVAGLEFFRVLVGHLAAAFQVKHAFVAELTGEGAARRLMALSVWRSGTRADPFDRPVEGTPCELVLARGVQNIPRDAAVDFPADRWLRTIGASGYFGAPLLDAGGNPAGVLAVLDDRPLPQTDAGEDILTTFAARASVELQRARVEHEIRRLNVELEQRVIDRTADLEAANHELEAFSYSVSHDLRAPLRHISGFVELLKDEAGAALTGPAADHVAEITRAADRMGTLIDVLLDFSRLARTELNTEPVDLSALAEAAAEELTRETGGRDVRWSLGAVPLVRGDRALLRQVVVNLLSNAVKYSRPQAVARIEVGAESGDDESEVVFFVRDNGVGFDMARARKMFGVFERLHPSSEFEGTGIGLANVQRIVMRHGGRVWAESQPGAGATFFVALPSAALASAAKAPAPARPGQSGPR